MNTLDELAAARGALSSIEEDLGRLESSGVPEGCGGRVRRGAWLVTGALAALKEAAEELSLAREGVAPVVAKREKAVSSKAEPVAWTVEEPVAADPGPHPEPTATPEPTPAPAAAAAASPAPEKKAAAPKKKAAAGSKKKKATAPAS